MTVKNRKTQLGVLFGGRSSEYEISLISAASVIEALINQEDFEIIAIGFTRTGRLACEEELRAMLPDKLHDHIRLCTSIETVGSGMKILPNPPAGYKESDVVPEIIFPLLHGAYGEDGTVQGLFEIADIPYVGCGVLASSLALDKDIVKRLWAGEGLPVTPWITVRTRDIAVNLSGVRIAAEKAFGYPMFSKPANLGSSVGVHKIHDAMEFDDALRDSAQYDRKVLIEKGIDAREIECAILGNDNPMASVTGEVISGGEFYDYDAKYVRNESRLEIPADIDGEKAEEIKMLAIRAFQAIDGTGLARVDFFMEKKTGKIWINEINTMPGFTPISMYAKLWAESGVPFTELVHRLIRLGKDRFEEKSARKTDVPRKTP